MLRNSHAQLAAPYKSEGKESSSKETFVLKGGGRGLRTKRDISSRRGTGTLPRLLEERKTCRRNGGDRESGFEDNNRFHGQAEETRIDPRGEAAESKNSVHSAYGAKRTQKETKSSSDPGGG